MTGIKQLKNGHLSTIRQVVFKSKIMDNFKGTKGKWEVDEYNNVSVGYNEIAFLRSSTPNMERRANAQLIAHAPEMLEMLQSIVGKPAFKEYFPATRIEVLELIEKATTI